MRLLSDTLMETIEGQALDMNARNRSDIKVEAYMDLVTRKTGRYLAAPLVGGALCAGASETTIQLLANLGPILGPLFQILDDLIDLSKGKGRESIGNDVREGKRSYLAVHTLNHATPAQQVRLQQILDAPREQTTLDMVSEAADLMERTGAMEAARQEAQRLRGAARRKMAGLYPPALAQALSVVLDYLASRQQ
jgi:geranylgeranyl diphosphate synthase type I